MSQLPKENANTLLRSTLRGDGLRAILQALRIHTKLTRSEIARMLKVSPATVSHWVQDLLDGGWVVESDGKAWTPGRPSSCLTLNPNAANALVADVTHDGIEIAMVNFIGEVVARENIEEPMADFTTGSNLLLSKLRSWIANPNGIEISGVSLVFPGIWNDVTRNLLFSSSLPGWVGMDIPTHSLGIPVIVDNDANSAAVGEAWFGEQVDTTNALVVLLRWGIGSAVLHARDIFGGSRNGASGLGHMIVANEPDAPLCDCGNQGCLEAVVGRTMRRVLGRTGSPGDVDDSEMQSIVTLLGSATANMVNLLGIQEIVMIGDSLTNAPALWEMWVQETRRLIMPHMMHSVRFRRSALGERAAILGGAWNVFNQVLGILDKREAL